MCAHDCLLQCVLYISGAFLTDPGACEEAIAKQARMYTAYKEDMRIQGKPGPKGDGVLVFDEVKVVARLLDWL